uniref:Uncharacterized protein n=1 Tax=Arundo donax TaxID=35708 RepID=A0A0A9BCU2_ARUDO
MPNRGSSFLTLELKLANASIGLCNFGLLVS